MTTERGEQLLKCDHERTKSFSKVHDKISRKCLCVIGVFIFIFVIVMVSCFVQSTLWRINKLENALRTAEATIEEVKRMHDDMYFFLHPVIPKSFEEDDDSDYDYQTYFDYPEYEHSADLTKDEKPSSQEPNETTSIDYHDREKKIFKRSISRDDLISPESNVEIKGKNTSHKKRIRHSQHREKAATALPVRSSSLENHRPILQSEHAYETKPKQNIASEEPLKTEKSSAPLRGSRVKHSEDSSKLHFKAVKKSLLKSGDMEYESYSEEVSTTEVPIVREVNFGKQKKSARTRPLITIQFNGDTSKYVLGQHDNFNGNGHLRHPHRNFIDWIPSDWVKKTGMDSHFSLNQGEVFIKQSGLYFIYAQIYYLDEHDTTGYRVYKNSNMILQCTLTQHSSVAMMKGNTCYTAGVEFLSAGDIIYLRDVTPGKYSLFEPGKSFFGLIKLGDFKNK